MMTAGFEPAKLIASGLKSDSFDHLDKPSFFFVVFFLNINKSQLDDEVVLSTPVTTAVEWNRTIHPSVNKTKINFIDSDFYFTFYLFAFYDEKSIFDMDVFGNSAVELYQLLALRVARRSPPKSG